MHRTISHTLHRSLVGRGVPVVFGVGIVAGVLLASRADPARAAPFGPNPAPRASGKGAPCPVTWPVFSSTATLIRTLPDGVCPTFPCETAFGQNEEFVTDLDGDGTEELVSLSEPYGGCAPNLACVALRRVDGEVRVETIFGGQPLDVPFADADDWIVASACIDVTGDRLPDLVFKVDRNGSDEAPDAIGYFANVLRPPSMQAAADIDRDGDVDALDLSMLLAAWGPVR